MILAAPILAAPVLAAAVSGCNMGEEKVAACERDPSQCPVSERLSTDVACDCRCVAGYSGLTPTREFEGTVPVCLPPELNAKLATGDQLSALNAMPDEAFNQKVFKYCSDKVATFLDSLIEEQQRPEDLDSMCVGPRIRCSCTTTGAQGETGTCSTPCEDTKCDKQNCISLLKVGGGVDAAGCGCSRVDGCGSLTPAEGESPVCVNRVQAVLRRHPANPTPN